MKCRSLFVLAVFLLCEPSFALRTDKIMVPQEVVDHLRKDFDLRNAELKPVRIPIEVHFTGENFERKAVMDVGKRSLDVATFINNRLKSFNFKMHLQMDPSSDTRLYFISRYKKTKSQSEDWGVGCGQMALIQSKMDQLVNGEGVDLNVLSGHYINVIGGDYLIAHKKGDILYFAYFRLRDRRWVDRLCKVKF